MTEVGGVTLRRLELALFAVTFFTFAYFYQAADQSTACRFDLMRSLTERHTLSIDGYAGYNTADIIWFGGHIYSVKAPGGALTGIIPWVLSTVLLTPVASHSEPLYWALSTYFTIVLSTSLLSALLSVIVFRFAMLLGQTPARSAAVALILAFGTIMFPYSTEMTGEPIAGVCLFAAFYLLATQRANEARWTRAMLAGFAAGWAVLSDYPALLIAVALAVYALVKLDRFRDIAAFGVGAAAVALVLMAYNKGAFGSWTYMSYQAYKLQANSQFPEQAVGFVGLTYPKPFVLWKILLDPQRGLLYCNPVLWLAAPGLYHFIAREREHRAEAVLTGFAILSFVLFNGSFGESIVSWGGGTATGPRQMAAAVPFMAITLAVLPRRYNYLLGALGLVSVFLMLMATSTEPHFPYEYQDPMRDFALPSYLRADFGTCKSGYFGNGLVVGDSVAFNLGGLFGLPYPVQLMPLGAFWVGGALFLIRELQLFPYGPKRALAMAAAATLIFAMFAPPLTVGAQRTVQGQAPHGLLGRYYEGNDPGPFPPHIVRVDPVIDFNNVAELGALPFPSCVVWTGKLLAPRSGRYRFYIDVDDAAWLTIDRQVVIRDPGRVTQGHAEGAVALGRGRHRIELGMRNTAGDASIHLSWEPPGAPREVIGSDYLFPSLANEALR